MHGAAGDFFSITWPGYVGALTALAPSRFAACVNQAPIRRHTTQRWLRGYDFARNVLAVWRSDGLIPPDQLLRQTFELCADFAAARRMLETTPVSRPVIYVLVGRAAGERCVIERTETGFGKLLKKHFAVFRIDSLIGFELLRCIEGGKGPNL